MEVLHRSAAGLLACVFVSLVGFGSPANAVAKLVPQSDSVFSNVAPEKCQFFGMWNGLPKPDPKLDSKRSPSEIWLAQEPIQLAIKKLDRAIKDYMSRHPMKDATMNEFFLNLPELLTNPATAFISEIDDETGFAAGGYGGIIVQLGDRTEWMKDIVRKIQQTEGERFMVEDQVVGMTVFKGIDVPEEVGTFVCAFRDEMMILGFGNDSLASILENMNSPTPSWLVDLKKESVVERPLIMGYAELGRSIELLKKTVGEDYPDYLKLEEIEGAGITMGMDELGFVVHAYCHCPKNTEGILSVMETQGITPEELKEIPDDVLSGSAARISIEKIWQLVQEGMAATGQDQMLNMQVEMMEDNVGLDFENDVLTMFDDYGFLYSRITLGSPTGNFVASLKVRDPVSFEKHLANINDLVDGRAVDSGATFSEKKSNGQTVYSFKQGNFGGMTLGWCYVDGQLLVSNDSKAISTHLRKRKRNTSSLADDEWFKHVFNANDELGLKNPVFVSYVDLAPVIQIAFPLLRAFLESQDFEADFDFTIDDVPDAETLTNGLKPNLAALYRNDTGFHFVERSTIPVTGISTSGILVGMMLPAVQQVRHAARRAQSMNNVRQLVLASLNYESAYGSFPPSYTKGLDETKLLSWRVHILPYLEEQELYEQFHLDEPWDSEHNLALVEQMPDAFVNPAVNLEPGETTYLGVSGKDGAFMVPTQAFEGQAIPTGVTFAEIRDGTSNTVAIVDVNEENSVIWTKPSDFDPDNLDDVFEPLSGTWLGGIVQFGMCDGSAHTTNSDLIGDDNFMNMLRKSDGNAVDTDW